MRKSRIIPFSVLLVLGLSAGLSAQSLDPDVAKALDRISGPEAYSFVKKLASPEFAGRLTGHEGYTAAAEWAAGVFRSWGLKPGGKGGFLQPYPSSISVIKNAEMSVFLPDGKSGPGREQSFREIKLVPQEEFLPLLFSDSGDRTGGTVFAGWGISAPELGYDDYAGLDVKGKFVFCFRGTPDGDKKYQEYDEHRTRMKTALDKGALGIIYIYPEVVSNPNGDRLKGFTPAIVTDKVMDSILKEIGSSTAELKKSLQGFKRPISFPLRARVGLKVEAEYFPDAVGYNIIGYVEGRDPKLRGECIVIGGHFDHNGLHMGLLFGGADDNASGSATVMETARAFASLKSKPRRTLVFVLFGGEEQGLEGSQYFADHPPSFIKRMDAMFNFDMTGEGDGLGGAVSLGADDLRKNIEDADRTVKIIRNLGAIRDIGVRGSDHAAFHAKGIPVAVFGSNGPHLAYHQTGDNIFRINPDIMAEAARLAFLASYYRADRNQEQE